MIDSNMTDDLFEIEREKIPSFLRWTERKKQVLKVLSIILAIVVFLIIVFFPRSYGAIVTCYETMEDGTKVATATFHLGYILAIITGLLLFIPVFAYFLTAYVFEVRAYSNANRTALSLAQDRRNLIHEKDMELIRHLHNEEAVGVIRKDQDREVNGNDS